MATEIEKLILAIETVGFKRSQQELTRLKKEAQGATAATNQLGNSAVTAGQKFSKMRGPTSALTTTTGQLSVQLQDVAVQAQQGTDFLRIFAQQGPQIASIFGPQGAVFGAVIAFGALLGGPLIASIIGAKEELADLSDEIDKVFTSFNDAGPAVQNYIRLNLEEKIRQQESAARDFANQLQRFAREMAQSADSSQESIDKLVHLQAQQELATAKAKAYREELQNLGKDSSDRDKAVQRIIESLTMETMKLQESGEALIKYRAIKAGATEEELKAILAIYKYNEGLEDQKKKEEELAAFKDRLTKARNAAVLKEAAETKRREEKEAEDRRKRIEKEKQLRVEDALERMRLDKEMKENAINTAADGLKAIGKYNKDAFEASKAVESGRAIMQTYSGATKALADLPFPYNIAAAAGIVAFGLAQVAQIQSQSYSGRAVGGQVRAGESYIVGERGPEVLTMGKTGSIIPNDRLRGSQGQVVNKTANVTFQITTNDTAGFDDLLRSRRGQIIGIINEALNDQGKAALA